MLGNLEAVGQIERALQLCRRVFHEIEWTGIHPLSGRDFSTLWTVLAGHDLAAGALGLGRVCSGSGANVDIALSFWKDRFEGANDSRGVLQSMLMEMHEVDWVVNQPVNIELFAQQ